MKSVFNRVLLELARQDKRIFMITGDIGRGVLEPFREALPDRFFNAGVAEQNMTGLACGLALEGKIAVTYSIANFPTFRCFEQIRNDVCYLKANVKIVSIGAGLGYGALGMSHHATEDLAVMRALPNMVVVTPGDVAETEAATRAMIAHEGPFYFRCPLKKDPPLHEGPIDFKIGQAIEVCQGEDATVISTGTIGTQAHAAVKELAQEGIRCRLLSMHTVKPIDREAILAAARETGAIITVEEHVLQGGLGGAAAEVLCDANVYPRKFLRLALPDKFISEVGSQAWLLDRYGLSAAKIAASIKSSLH